MPKDPTQRCAVGIPIQHYGDNGLGGVQSGKRYIALPGKVQMIAVTSSVVNWREPEASLRVRPYFRLPYCYELH